MSAKRSSHLAGMAFAGLALGCGVWTVGVTAEQPYPNRLIKLVVPIVAGGPIDIVARAIADKLSVSLKQPFVIENRPGAGGNIGADVVAKAAPDGHTLGLVLNTTLTVNPSLYKKLPFDPDKDFRPISIVTTSGNMLVVHPSVPVNSVAEFVAFAKAAAARKEPITYASGGHRKPWPSGDGEFSFACRVRGDPCALPRAIRRWSSISWPGRSRSGSSPRPA